MPREQEGADSRTAEQLELESAGVKLHIFRMSSYLEMTHEMDADYQMFGRVPAVRVATLE